MQFQQVASASASADGRVFPTLKRQFTEGYIPTREIPAFQLTFTFAKYY